MATNTGLGVNFDDVYVLLQSPNGKKTFQETTCESPLSEAQFADTTMKTKTTTKAKLDERKGKEKDIKCKRIVSNVKQKLGDFGDIRKLLSDGGISVVDIKATATTMTNVPPSPCNGLRNLTTTKPKRELLSNTSGNKTSKSAESVLSFVKSIIATAPRQKVAAPSITSFDSSAIVPAVSISSSSFSTSSSLSSLSSIANNGINGRPSQRLKKQKFRSATDISSLSSTSFSKQKSLMLPLPPQEKATRARSQSTSNLLTPSPKKTLLPMMDYIRDSHAINETTFAHIFIDHSNIYWGFKDYVKRSRNNSLEKGKTELNYEMLFNILLSPLKGPPRKLVKGVLVGSAPMDNGEEVLQVTQAHGFEAHILYRVDKPIPSFKSEMPLPWVTGLSKPQANPLHAIMSTSYPPSHPPGSSSSNTTPLSPTAAARSKSEQGVDELIALKIAESLLDFEFNPGTLVLLSGDGNRSEYNGFGFVTNVGRALKRGWNVEVWSWRRQMSSNYEKYFGGVDGFSLVYLDDFVDVLLRCEKVHGRKIHARV